MNSIFYCYLSFCKEPEPFISEEISGDLVKNLQAPGGLSSFYINFSSNINNIPSHKDALDNFYWQCQGSVEWKANGNTYVIEPGDLVFIPAKTHHAVNFSGPRAAIGFSVDLNE